MKKYILIIIVLLYPNLIESQNSSQLNKTSDEQWEILGKATRQMVMDNFEDAIINYLF